VTAWFRAAATPACCPQEASSLREGPRVHRGRAADRVVVIDDGDLDGFSPQPVEGPQRCWNMLTSDMDGTVISVIGSLPGHSTIAPDPVARTPSSRNGLHAARAALMLVRAWALPGRGWTVCQSRQGTHSRATRVKYGTANGGTVIIDGRASKRLAATYTSAGGRLGERWPGYRRSHPTEHTRPDSSVADRGSFWN